MSLTDSEWIALMYERYGRKTINEVRAECGIAPVDGGDVAYIDWLRRMTGLPLRPDLRVVPRDEP